MPLIRFQNLRYEECKDEVFVLTENAVDGMRVVKPSALSRWLSCRIPTWNFPFFLPIVTSNIYLNSCSTYWTPWSRELTMAAGTGAGAGAGAASLGGGELDRCPSVPLPRTFDKTEFDCDLHITALRIPAKECQHYMKLLSMHLLNRPRMRNVLDDPEDKTRRLLLLEEGLEPEGFSDREVSQVNKLTASEAVQLTLKEIVERNGLDVTEAVVKLDYSHTSTYEALKRLLPEGVEVPSSFEQIGHIAHLNLREEHLPFKYIIGAVILDKNPKIKTVINKIGTIDNEWRVFSMELLAGEENTVAEVKQHGARFRLDFQKVYWNSRLEAEHLRLVERWFKPGDVVADAMAGVGPFTIPAAKFKGCTVLANDLNPDSYKWLKVNIGINKVESLVSSFNLDGREFLRLIASREFGPIGKSGAEGSQKPEGPAVKHIIMNLPATAVEFLDALRGSFDGDTWRDDELPMVHVYAFVRVPVESVDHLKARIEKALGCNLDLAPEFHQVRDVAPNKHMYCASFRVPRTAAFVSKTKRQKTDDCRLST